MVLPACSGFFAQRTAAKETADAVVQQAEAAIETADLQLSYTKIFAPIDGQISRTNVTRGNLVGQGGSNTVLTTIVSMDPLYVWFDAPEKDLIEYQRSLKENAGKTIDEIRERLESADRTYQELKDHINGAEMMYQEAAKNAEHAREMAAQATAQVTGGK